MTVAMIAPQFIRRLPLLLLALALGAASFGCSNDQQLTVRGEAAVARGAEAVERFDFPQDVALQRDDLAASAEGVFGGHCFLDQGALTQIDAEVSRPRATSGMTAFRVQSSRDGGGAVRAVIDGQVYDGTSDGGACTITALYAEFGDGLAGVSADCAVTDADGNAAQATADLHFAGCDTLND